MPQLAIQLLGTPVITIDGKEVRGERRKAIALLSYLAATGESQSRETLATLLWPDYDSKRAYAYLRRTIWELNKMLGEGWLTVDREFVALNQAADIQVDLHLFHQKLDQPISSDPSQDDYSGLEDAIDLYQNDFMHSFYLSDSQGFDEWQQFQRDSVRRHAAEGLEKLVQAYLKTGQYQKAISAAQKWVRLDEFHEPAHRFLIRAYAQAGQRSAAIRHYDSLVQQLSHGMGLEPEQETLFLVESIRQGEFRRDPVHSVMFEKPRIDDQESIPRFPVPLTPFVGRSEELEDVSQLLNDPTCRLLTLVGPGGIGKTRLALQSAAALQDNYPDGAIFVGLSALSSGEDILPALAKGLHYTYYEQDNQPRQQVLNFLRNKKILLLFDNFEHVISDENIQFLLEILSTAYQVKILITSRASLNLQGENLYAVAGMEYPAGDIDIQGKDKWQDFSAIVLFAQCAKRANPGFDVSGQNLTHIVSICQSVQGMPLGIELAATWLEVLSESEIAEEIKQSLDFLETDQRDIPIRQRSLRAVFETTWRYLKPEEQDIYQRLSIFQGSFTREAAQAVAGANLRDLADLTHKSLLQHDERGRYWSHELLRQYAFDKLASNMDIWWDVRDQHSSYYASFLSRASHQKTGSQQTLVMKSIDLELENITLGWHWMIIHQYYDQMWQVVQGMLPYLWTWFFSPVIDQLIDPAIEMLEDERSEETLAKNLLATLMVVKSNSYSELTTGRPVQYCRRAEAIFMETGSLPDLGIVYTLFGTTYGWYADLHKGIEFLQECLSILRENDQRWEIAVTERMLAQLLFQIDNRNEARKLAEESTRHSWEIGDLSNYALGLNLLGNIAGNDQDLDRAIEYNQQALEIFEEIGDIANVSLSLYSKGHLYVSLGEYAQAVEHYRTAEMVMQDIGNLNGIASMIGWQSIALMRMGEYDRARELRQRSLDLAIETSNMNDIVWGYFELGEIIRLQGDLGTAREMYEKSWHYFQDLKLFSPRPFYYRGIGDIAFAEGDYLQAKQQFQKSTQLAMEEYHAWMVIYAQVCLARAQIRLNELAASERVLAEALRATLLDSNVGLKMLAIVAYAELNSAKNQYPQAAELASLAIETPATWQEYRDIASEVLLTAARNIPSESLTRAQMQGKNADWEFVIGELLSRSNA